MVSKKCRIQFLDIAKAIAIILMVLGHSSMPKVASVWIYSFHMPLFFIAMGVTYSVFTKDNILRKIKNRVVPFIFFSVICILVESYIDKVSIIHKLSKVLHEGWGGMALWFLPVLFMAELLMALFTNLPLKLRNCIVLFSFILASLQVYYKILLPWSIHSVPGALGYALLAYNYRMQLLSFIWSKKNKYVIMCVCFLIGFLLSQSYRSGIDPNLINPYIIQLEAICGTMAVFIFSQILNRTSVSRGFKYIGRNTLIVLGLSQPFMHLLILWVGKDYSGITLLLSTVLRYVLLAFLLWASTYAINRFIPWAIGRKAVTSSN